ncbi:MAG: FprA family A-type flavoprotein [Bacteroidales bacterium]|nr:FprA family A-type flavoprotein [Bacteroidales bacterium]
MHNTRKISRDYYWVGASDRRLELFENVMPITKGVSYNSYLLMDEKTVLLDTADSSVSRQFLENVQYVLNGRALDYLIVNHMEPDHCSIIEDIVLRHPNLKIIGNAKTLQMINQFFDFDVDSRFVAIKEGDTFSTGTHTLQFVMAPMVHWPEAMFTYDIEEKILFSADAFGTFGALNGNIFNDEINFEKDWLDEARRYYTNIVGKYGNPVQAALKKAGTIDIQMICPLHGPIWRNNLGYILDKYVKWSTYEPEDKAVMLVYGSMYGNTEAAVNVLATKLAEAGVKNIVTYSVSNTHVSHLIAEAFRCSHIVLAAPTYNSGLFTPMENFLMDLKAHGLQKRTFAFIENGTWAPTAACQMMSIVGEMKDSRIIDETLTLRSSMKESQIEQLELLANDLAAELNASNPR